MTAPPWGHKPPAVDRYAYWLERPPQPSPRCGYWVRRLAEGSWHPNKYLGRNCYDCSAQWLGVYIWEYVNVLAPLIREERQQREVST